MNELSELQIELISNYIRQNGVASDELHDDLLDHICTDIENRMQKGDSFEDAFQYTVRLFGPGGLIQVQQDTFELLTEINATMKNVTFGFGLTSTFLLLAGTIFKLMHWPGAGIMITFGATLLVLAYFPLMLYFKIKESRGKDTLMHVAGFIGLTLGTLGVLFKIMHWPGASILLVSGLILLAFVYVPIHFFKKYRTSVNKPITFSAGMLAVTGLILIFALSRSNSGPPTKDGISIVEWHLRESAASTGENQPLYNRLGQNPQAEEVKQVTKETLALLESLRDNIIAVTEGISVEDAQSTDLYHMRYFALREEHSKLLFSEAANSDFRYTRITDQLTSFRSAVLEVYPEPLRSELAAIFPIDVDRTYKSDGIEADWAHYYFDHTPVFTVLSVIANLQNDIRQAENQALIYLLSQPGVSNPPS